MQSGIDAADALHAALAAGDCSRRRFGSCERDVRRRYEYFRRFAIGLLRPAVPRPLLPSQSAARHPRGADLGPAGNWRPSLVTRLRIALFFGAVALQRHVGIAPRPRPGRASGPGPAPRARAGAGTAVG
jgi:hypothetical protein